MIDSVGTRYNEVTVYCNVCKGKPAVYFRVFSGDKLCLSCLRRQLMRSVKRSIGRTGAFKPRSKIMVPISPRSPMASLGLADIMARLERSYGSKVIVVIIENLLVEIKGLERLVELGVDVETFSVDVNSLPIHQLDCMRLERSIYLKISSIMGVNAIALAISRTELALAALDALLTGDPIYWSESLDYIDSNPPIIAAFSNVEAEAVTAYSVLSGYRGDSMCKPRFRSKRIFYSISSRRPELEFSSSKTVDLLSSAASKGYKRCTLCYGYSEGEVCSVCRSLRVDSISVRRA
ncbi:MAG: hypothetical protein F7C81_01085 [Desulfurococcales archaeon]|nr:hypothetical protein [Desulfurococcales archaeon]